MIGSWNYQHNIIVIVTIHVMMPNIIVTIFGGSRYATRAFATPIFVASATPIFVASATPYFCISATQTAATPKILF